MTCAILTADRVDGLLNGTVSAADRRMLLEHLSSPCEACLDVLSGPAGEAMLARLGAGGLSPDEVERIFAAAVPAGLQARTRRARVPPWARRASLAFAAAACVAILVLVPQAFHLTERESGRLKGTVQPAPRAGLVVFAGKPGAPQSVHPLGPGEKLGREEVLLFRIRTSAPAFVYLVGSGDWGPAIVLWPDKPEQARPRPAGEFEVSRGPDALSIDPRELGRDPQIVLIASPRSLDPALLTGLPREEDQIASALPGCAVEILRPLLEPP